MTPTRIGATALIVSALALGTTGCGPDSANGTSPTTSATVTVPSSSAKSSSSTTPPTTVDPTQDAYRKAEAVARRWATEIPATGKVAADFLTADYVKQENEGRKAITDAGYHPVNTETKLISLKAVDYRTSPALATTVRVCSEGDPRLVDQAGKDMTYDTQGNLIPKGLKRTATLLQITTPDGGATWQVNSAQSDGNC